METIPINKLWDLDAIRINAQQPLPEDSISYQDYIDSVRYKDGQYWVRLPWKVNKPDLPNNYHRALGQMNTLVKELHKKELIEN